MNCKLVNRQFANSADDRKTASSGQLLQNCSKIITNHQHNSKKFSVSKFINTVIKIHSRSILSCGDDMELSITALFLLNSVVKTYGASNGDKFLPLQGKEAVIQQKLKLQEHQLVHKRTFSHHLRKERILNERDKNMPIEDDPISETDEKILNHIDISLQNDISRKMLYGAEVKPPFKYPYMVYGGKCGASLIAPNVLLSAAHCKDVIHQVQIGRHDLTQDTEVYETFSIIEKVIHPMYDSEGPSSFDYDYMVMKMDGSSIATPIELDHGSISLTPGREAIVMGWGSATSGGPSSDILQELEVLVYGTSVCKQLWHDFFSDNPSSYITDRNFCAAVENSFYGPCNGDSGSPLVDKSTGKQIGIVSFGDEDCSSSPTVYAKVQDQISFIDEYISKWSDSNSPKCMDYPGWTDDYGHECSWYQVNDLPGCPIWSGCGFCEWPNGKHDEACCYCGGGTLDETTPAPTLDPVPSPTFDPTPIPSSGPTMSPTPDPTPYPTREPTWNQTSVPTSSPTFAPTFAQTSKPTLSPTPGPILAPTSSPTFAPTLTPTSNPTHSPTPGSTSDPTSSPTFATTFAPTSKPTLLPTSGPTLVPTSSPTFDPTLPPTSNPSSTSNPTGFEDVEPSPDPVMAPNFVPTGNTTLKPTESFESSASSGSFRGSTGKGLLILSIMYFITIACVS